MGDGGASGLWTGGCSSIEPLRVITSSGRGCSIRRAGGQSEADSEAARRNKRWRRLLELLNIAALDGVWSQRDTMFFLPFFPSASCHATAAIALEASAGRC